jgi:ADP-ribose pyrophosphatase
MSEPRIQDRRNVFANRWVTLQEKDVLFPGASKPESYYSLKAPDYICVIGETSDGRIPIIRQYRPAVESMTWEFPSGLGEEGETHEMYARREFEEETGYRPSALTLLGVTFTDVGRLDNRQYGFYATGLVPIENHVMEEGLEVRLVTRAELEAMIDDGSFNFALHLAVWERFLRKVSSQT